MLAAIFFSSLDTLELKPEQKTAIDGIEADLEKVPDAAAEPRRKLANDIADGVAAGKIDRAKTDADIRGLTAAVAAAQPGVQDALNRLHKTLEPEQRKKLIETMREKARSMQEHGMMGPGMHGGPGPGMHGGMGPGMHGGMQGGPGPAGPGNGPGMGPGMQGGPGPGKGPAAPGQGGPGPGAPAAGAPTPAPGAPPSAPPAPGPGGMGHGMHGGMGPGKGPGPGMHDGGPGDKDHGMGPDMHDGGPMMMHLSQELGLTPEQQQKLRTQLEAQHKAQEAAMKNRMTAMQKHMTAVGDAFMTDKFDAKKVGVGAQAADMAKAMATQHLKMIETVLAVLTPEQRAKFAQHIREHFAEHDADKES